MDINAVLALIGATTVLVSIPGPNVALFVANTIAYGMRYGAATVLGTTIGVALQLGVTARTYRALELHLSRFLDHIR